MKVPEGPLLEWVEPCTLLASFLFHSIYNAGVVYNPPRKVNDPFSSPDPFLGVWVCVREETILSWSPKLHRLVTFVPWPTGILTCRHLGNWDNNNNMFDVCGADTSGLKSQLRPQLHGSPPIASCSAPLSWFLST